MARLKAGKRVLELERSLKEANDKIKILSITDPLTGIYNRGYLTEHLPREISRAKRYGHPLSLIMSDIDLFKKINDSYGHQAGDKLLKDFVDCLRGAIRNRIDWMVRYGGEEFLIVLPETNIEGACQVAERFRTLLSESVFTIKDNEIKITASFGVSGFDPSKQKEKISVEFLIGLADKYLYQAKKRGRNRVEALKIDD